MWFNGMENWEDREYHESIDKLEHEEPVTWYNRLINWCQAVSQEWKIAYWERELLAQHREFDAYKEAKKRISAR